MIVEELIVALEEFGEHLTVIMEHGPTERKFHVDSVVYGTGPDGMGAVILRVSKVLQREEI